MPETSHAGVYDKQELTLLPCRAVKPEGPPKTGSKAQTAARQWSLKVPRKKDANLGCDTRRLERVPALILMVKLHFRSLR